MSTKPTISSFWQGWQRSCGAGLVWLILLFFIESLNSYIYFLSATKRLRSNEGSNSEIKNLLVQAVVEYAGSIFLGYIFLAVFAAAFVHIVSKLWFVQFPERKRWWKVVFSFMVIFSLLAHARNIITAPTMYVSMGHKLNQKVSDALDFWMIDSVSLILSCLAFFWVVRRWKDVSLQIMSKRIALLVGWALLTFVILRHPSPAKAQKNSGLNVIIIGVDALRPDHLIRNGYKRETAPNLEKLLDDSVSFSEAYTTLARTFPAWMSILTGRWPSNNGIRDNLPHPDMLVPDMTMLPQAMKKAGYHTTFLTDDSRFSYMTKEMGFDRILQPKISLMNFAISASEPRFRTFHALMHNPIGYWLVPVLRNNQAFGKSFRPELLTTEVLDALAESSKHERFLLAMHSCVLHAPGDRNHPYSRMYDQRGYSRKNRFRFSRSGSTLLPSEVSPDAPAVITSEQDSKIYDSGMQMADQMVEGLVRELKRSGLWENTIIVSLSDHGENLWRPQLPYKYHGPNHGYHPYDDGQHQVMMAMRFPDGHKASQFNGNVRSEPVRLIDLAPTLIEVLGLPWKGSLDGVSMMPLVRGEKESSMRTVYIETGVSEKGYWQKNHRRYPFKSLRSRYAIHPSDKVYVKRKFMRDIISAKDRLVQMGKWKLVWRPTKQSGVIELYDREKDPANLNNVILKYPEIAAHLGKKMLPFLNQDGEKNAKFYRWKRLAEDSTEPAWQTTKK